VNRFEFYEFQNIIRYDCNLIVIMERKKVALFREDFNPITNGDVDMVKQVVAKGLVDEVWMVPGMQHQFDWELVDAELRIDMIKLALDGVPNVKLCREEIDFPGMLSQYDTLNRLRKKFDYDFVWLGRSDLCHDVIKWYRFPEVLKMVDFIIFEKKNYPLREVENMRIIDILKPSAKFISSAGVRLRVIEGTSIREFVPLPVERFIQEKGLYTSVDLP
jgi:nicotinate-nucleotide adenylyltransferase